MKKIIVVLLLLLCVVGCSKDNESNERIIENPKDVFVFMYKFKADLEVTYDQKFKFITSSSLQKSVYPDNTYDYSLILDPAGNNDLNNIGFSIIVSSIKDETLEQKVNEIEQNENFKNIIQGEKTIHDNTWSYYSYEEHREDVTEDFLVHHYLLEKEFDGEKELISIRLLKAYSSDREDSYENVLMDSIQFLK